MRSAELRFPRKFYFSGRVTMSVLKTDTGRQVKDTKGFERNLPKELGKLTP